MRGLLVVFDGIDGCGKSTQLSLAGKKLAAENIPVVMTREPGGTAISEKIRSIILSSDNGDMVDECELLLYAAARAQHVKERISPALDRGNIVLCDRFDMATFAYQGFGRRVPLSLIERVNGIASGGLVPDITFVFEISVEAAFKRRAGMNKSADRLEAGGADFFRRVAEGYRVLARKYPGAVELLDGALPAADVGEKVYRRIRKAYNACR